MPSGEILAETLSLLWLVFPRTERMSSHISVVLKPEVLVICYSIEKKHTGVLLCWFFPQGSKEREWLSSLSCCCDPTRSNLREEGIICARGLKRFRSPRWGGHGSDSAGQSAVKPGARQVSFSLVFSVSLQPMWGGSSREVEFL